MEILTRVVRYYSKEDAENAMRFINGTRLDDRIIRTDWDAGFIEGRQYGRGKSGGQVLDWHYMETLMGLNVYMYSCKCQTNVYY